MLLSRPHPPCLVEVAVAEAELERHRPALGRVAQFLESLSSSNLHGVVRVHRERDPTRYKHASLHFHLLNPETHFDVILRECVLSNARSLSALISGRLGRVQ